jgi:hypothetical protein
VHVDTTPADGSVNCVRVESKLSRIGSVERFHRLRVEAVARLPLGLDSVVAPTFPDFCLINGFTFVVVLLLQTVLRGGLGVPLPIARPRTEIDVGVMPSRTFRDNVDLAACGPPRAGNHRYIT